MERSATTSSPNTVVSRSWEDPYKQLNQVCIVCLQYYRWNTRYQKVLTVTITQFELEGSSWTWGQTWSTLQAGHTCNEATDAKYNIQIYTSSKYKIQRYTDAKYKKYNNAIRQPLPNMKYKYYRPMPNTKYKLANHCQIQNTVYTQYSLLSRYWDTINKERLFEFAIWRMMLAQTEARSRYDFAQILIYLSMESLPWCSCHSWDTPLHQRKYNIKRWIRKIYEECENPDLLNFWSWI